MHTQALVFFPFKAILQRETRCQLPHILCAVRKWASQPIRQAASVLVNTSLDCQESGGKEREEQGLRFDNNLKTGENVTEGGLQCVRQSKGQQAEGR